MKEISRFIDHLECPSLDGIIFPDGSIDLLNIEVEWGPPINYYIKIGEKSSIKLLETKNKLQWSDCAILISSIDEKHSIEILAGEGNYGSDGFVSVIDLSSRNLIWLAFFKCSNPFNKLEAKHDEIHAVSTNGCLWKFRIKNPVYIVVECPTIGNARSGAGL